MSLSFKYGFLMVVLLALASCNRNTEEVISEQGTVAKVELVNALDSLSNKTFNSFYSKIATSYSDSSRSLNFKTSTWMIADSASNFLISYASFPVVGALVTQDSVKVSNKREKCYIYASLDFLSTQFGTSMSLNNLEDILLGIPTNFDAGRTYYQHDTEKGRTLCTHGLKDIEQAKAEMSEEVITYYKLTEDLKELEAMTLYSIKDSIEIHIEYKTREMVEGLSVPTEVTVRILSPTSEINVELTYTKIRVNQPEKIQFVIPETYERCG